MAGWPLVGRGEELDLVARALRERSTRCVLVSGEAGVGKTRLAREVSARAERDRWSVRWAIATEQVRSIALGALVSLLPGKAPEATALDRFELLRWTRHNLVDRNGSRDLLVIDDAHLVDELTTALLQQVVKTDGPTRVLLTARTTELPSWLVALSRDDRVEHVRLDSLGEFDVRALVNDVLDGSVDPATQATLWAQSLGNVLWLRQLIRDGLESGALAERDGVWKWQGPVTAPSLREVLNSRLDGLPSGERAALELVGLGEPLPLPVVRALSVEQTLVALERRELVASSEAGVRMAHPLLGSLLRGQLTHIASEVIERRLIGAFRASGCVVGADALRVARWQLESGDVSAPDAMIMASRQALPLDPVLAERFARAALQVSAEPAGRYVLARSLLDQRRVAESAQLYAEMLAGPLPPKLWAEAMMDSAFFLLWVRGDALAAMEQLRAVESSATQFREHAASLRAAVAMFSGATEDAVRAGFPVTTTATDPRVLQLAAIAVVLALTLGGRVGEAIALVGRTRAALADVGAAPLGSAVGATTRDAQLGWEYAFALRWAARIDDAVADAVERLRRAAEEPVRHAESYGLRNAAAGSAYLAAGDVRSALDVLRSGAAVLRDADQVGMVFSCLADLARAEALAGDLPAAEALLAEAAERGNPAIHIFDATLGHARAIVSACSGELSRARTEAASAADVGRRYEQPLLEAACLHLAVRFGDPAGAARRLAELAEQTDAALVSIFAEHAEVAAASDAPGLERVSERLGAAGSRMLAASVAAAAARRYRGTGQGGAADRAARRSRSWSTRCPGAPTPSLLVEPVRLTVREQEVIGLVRRGLRNHEIAELLVVSVRTVESHLQHAYRKLGLQGRGELAELVDDPGA